MNTNRKIAKKLPDDFNINQFSSFMIDSVKCSVPTTESERISKEIIDLVSNGSCGAVIAGEPRIGKTRSIRLVTKKIHEKFGKDFPVYSWRCSERSTNTDKAFYTDLLKSFGFPTPNRGDTALDMKLRLINAIKVDAERTPMRKVIVFVDEANNMTQRDFGWLINLYNELEWEGSRLIVFLVGQAFEMRLLLEKLRNSKQNQIIGRFFTRFFDYHGIQNATSLSFLLLSIDTNITFKFGKNNIMISRDLFPYSYNQGSGLVELQAPLWSAFMEVHKKYEIHACEIPMQYMMATIKLIIQHYSIAGDGPSESLGVYPDVPRIVECIEMSGYQYYVGALSSNNNEKGGEYGQGA